MLNGHGDDIHKYGIEIASNFSSNVYNKLDLSQLREHLCANMAIIHSYPEPTGDSLVEKLAEKHQIQARNIILSNGATEAIYMIAQTYRNKRGTIITPTFSEYEDACMANDIELSYTNTLSEVQANSDLVWVCNPNNPTGAVCSSNELLDFAQNNPNTLLVVDQSYQYFTEKEVLSATQAIEYKNIILLQSMTKQFAIPGLRLGYAITHEDLIEKIERYRMPWSVNALAIEAGKYLLNNDLSNQLNISEYLEETQRLQTELSEIKGLIIYPTSTHFFLCRLVDKKAADLKEYLVYEKGLLIRDAANFRGLDANYFRIATQSADENNLLIKAIKEWLK